MGGAFHSGINSRRTSFLSHFLLFHVEVRWFFIAAVQIVTLFYFATNSLTKTQKLLSSLTIHFNYSYVLLPGLSQCSSLCSTDLALPQSLTISLSNKTFWLTNMMNQLLIDVCYSAAVYFDEFVYYFRQSELDLIRKQWLPPLQLILFTCTQFDVSQWWKLSQTCTEWLWLQTFVLTRDIKSSWNLKRLPQTRCTGWSRGLRAWLSLAAAC